MISTKLVSEFLKDPHVDFAPVAINHAVYLSKKLGEVEIEKYFRDLSTVIKKTGLDRFVPLKDRPLDHQRQMLDKMSMIIKTRLGPVASSMQYTDILPWDNAIDKKAKSSDGRDLGKIQSITKYYIQTKEGLVSKNYYFIPKYHIQGYDGDNLWVSMTKDEIKNLYERASPPSDSEFKTQEYEEQRKKVESSYPQFSYGVPFIARGVELKSESFGESLNILWEEVINKRVRTTDNRDIGDIETVGNEFIVVREGDVKIRHYYIPKSYITHYDGSSLWIDAPSGLVSGKFERETEPTKHSKLKGK